MERAKASVMLTRAPRYYVEARLEAEPNSNGDAWEAGSLVADKLLAPAFLITYAVATERLELFTSDAPIPGSSQTRQVESYRYDLHIVAALGLNVTLAAGAEVSGSWIMAQHDIYLTLIICTDPRLSRSRILVERTSGPAGDELILAPRTTVHRRPPSTETFK